jgi:hypothetical protein
LIIFGLVSFLSKNNNQTDFLKNQNWFKLTGFGSVFLKQKQVQAGLAWFF